MADAAEIRKSLTQGLLDAYREEYKELSETWRALEGKAQGTVAIAAVFIAAAFAYIRESSLQALYEKILLGGSIVSLVSTVLFSILALKIRKVAFPPLGTFSDMVVADLIKVDDESELGERATRFLNDQIDAWKRVRNSADLINQKKARLLWIAQMFLVAAILIFAMLTFSRLVKS